MSARLMALLTALGLAVQTFADVSVTNVTCRQRYPWNGLVDIDYTVVSDDPNVDVYVMAFGVDQTSGENVNMRTLSGDGVDVAVKPGRYRLTWNAKVDVSTFHSEDFVVHLTPFTGTAPYLVVDLSNGVNGGELPFRYSTRPPDISDDTCRTTEMWFRLIPPGTFMMGSKPDEIGYNSTYELRHEVTLTAPFYIAIFECTQQQWKQVMGEDPFVGSSYDLGAVRPAYPSYDDVCGSVLGAQWPLVDSVDEGSFLGVFRSRTRLRADIPTSAQWEYACRAGTTTGLNNGFDITRADVCPHAAELARYGGTRNDRRYSSYTTAIRVGSYKPNNWGVYDMHGNVSEWCRDWLSASQEGAVTNPVGSSVISYSRVCRGGAYGSQAFDIRSGRFGGEAPGSRSSWRGFRVKIAIPGT